MTNHMHDKHGIAASRAAIAAKNTVVTACFLIDETIKSLQLVSVIKIFGQFLNTGINFLMYHKNC